MQTLHDDVIDLASLLAPVCEAQPTGRDLEGSLALHALETAAREPDEPAIQGVESVDERDWRDVAAQARALLSQSKDLRVAVQLARALLHTDGLPGFCAGIALTRALAETYWDALYPAPDEDGFGERLNALRELWSPPLVAQLRATSILHMRELGTYGVNDVLVACGATGGRPALSEAVPQHVQTALASADLAYLQRCAALTSGACDDVRALLQLIEARTGVACPLDPSLLSAPSGARATGILDGLAVLLRPNPSASEPETDDAATRSPPAGAEHAPALHAAPRSRDDVVRTLELLCQYYARYEPSSPVPLLLQRAKRLATMSFVDLMRDLADQGLPQLAKVAGISLSDDD